MAGTMESIAMLTAGKSAITGGIEAINKRYSLQARVDKIENKRANAAKKVQLKKELVDKKESNREFLRENGSLIQGIADAFSKVSHLSKTVDETVKAAEKTKKKAEGASDDSGEEDEATTKRAKTGGRQKGTKNKVKEDTEDTLDVPEDTGAPSVKLPSFGGDSGGSVTGASTLGDAASNKIEMLYDSQLPVTSESMVALLEIERAELAINERREDRELKAERRALEDRRDKKGGALMGKLSGKPTLNKKSGGFMATVGKEILKFGSKYLLPLAGGLTTLFGIKKFLTGANNADDIARLADKTDDLIKASKKTAQVGSKMHLVDDALKGVAKTSQLGGKVTLVDDALKGIAKTSQLGNKVTLADDALKGIAKTSQLGNKVTLADDALKGIAKSSNIVNLTSKFDDVAKSSQLTGLLKNTTTKFDDLARAGAYAGDFTKLTSHVTTSSSKLMTLGSKVNLADNALTGIAKSSQLINHGPDFLKLGTGLTKLDDGLKAGVTATNLINYTDNFASLGTKMDKMDNVVSGISKTVTSSSSALKALSATDEAAKLAQIASNAPSLAGTNIVNVADNAAGSMDDAAKLAAKNAQTAKLMRAGGQTGGKLLSRFSKILAPLDIFNKMEQGQGLFESIANMGVELGGMVVGLADVTTEYNSKGLSWLTGGFMTESGQGLLGNKDSDGLISEGSWGDRRRALETGDVFDNSDKWDTSLLEKGINKVVAGVTGTEAPENKKQWTEEQKALALAAEESGAVDVNYLGTGDIDSLEKLSLLDPKSLEALLAYEVWSDKDMLMIERLMEAKKAGIDTTYNDNGIFGREGIDFGNNADGSASQFNVDDNYTGLSARDKEMDLISRQWQKDGGASAETKQRYQDIKAMTPEEYDDLSPSKEKADKLAEAGLAEGSIFTHDVHLEKNLQELIRLNTPAPVMMRPIGPKEVQNVGPAFHTQMANTPNQALEMSLVTKAMEGLANKKEQASTTAMLNAPISVDRSTQNITNTGTSAHAPASPSGSGYMGISAGRG